jgi:hypothetical protein
MAGCSKDKYTTKPQLVFKSVKDYNVPRGGLIVINLEMRDKEGDVSDSIFILTKTANCPKSDENSPYGYTIAEFPTSANLKAQVQITYENGTNNTGNAVYSANKCSKNDTTYFYFWMKDKAKNVSDTIRTDKPLIIQY